MPIEGHDHRVVLKKNGDHSGLRTTAASRSGRHRARTLRLVSGLAVLLMLVVCLYTFNGELTGRTEHHQPDVFSNPGVLTPQYPSPLSQECDTWSVLVQHEDAIDRLHLREQYGCSAATRQCNDLRLNPASLPSWTLRVVDPDCADCTDSFTYASAAATSRRLLPEKHAVFATASAPLGRIGPMLLAMASVTDDIDLHTELPRWRWLRQAYHTSGRRCLITAERATEDSALGTEVGGEASLVCHLAVIGVPSTDQPMRSALRDAQRQTWMTYREVARHDNKFDGALLPLYIFAAREGLMPDENSANGNAAVQIGKLGAAPQNVRSLSLAPTVGEYRAASKSRVLLANGDPGFKYVQRYTTLLPHWKVHRTENSPCGAVHSSETEGDAATSTLASIGVFLSLPVTPTFVSGSQYICCASAALWQEVLQHRDAVWVDMLTDRRPTTQKKLGDNAKWGLPVEVGMSQKLILWLNYAYTAFPDVPYIMKGDDDTYVKVPQFLSDVRYITGGMRGRRVSPVTSATATTLAAGFAAIRDDATLRPTRVAVADELQLGAFRHSFPVPSKMVGSEGHDHRSLRSEGAIPSRQTTQQVCLYWGSIRHIGSLYFNAGLLFLVHRKVIRAVLEPNASPAIVNNTLIQGKGVDIINLTLRDFDASLSGMYRDSYFHREDILLGHLIRNRLPRVQELCAGGKLYYVGETFKRFHDYRRGRHHPLTWATVVAHRCSSSDMYFSHYFFRKEFELRSNSSAAVIQNAVAEWVHQVAVLYGRSSTGEVKPPPVVWNRTSHNMPNFQITAWDKVAIYAYPYSYRHDPQAPVLDRISSSL